MNDADPAALAAMRIAVAFIDAFRTEATQLNGYRIAGRWWKLRVAHNVTPSDAAAWANLGFLPEEAEPLIRDGISPQQHREMEDHAEGQAGGAEALAAMRIAELTGSGALLGEDDVIRVQDPHDPRREIIVPRDELDGR